VGKFITDLSSVTTVGLDLAKHVFQVHGVDASGRVVVAKAMMRNKRLEFFASLPACIVGLEASESAHHWARELVTLGHEARMMPPAYVKPYIRRQKNDAAAVMLAFDAVCRRALAGEPGDVDASQDAGDVGLATHAAHHDEARPLQVLDQALGDDLRHEFP